MAGDNIRVDATQKYIYVDCGQEAGKYDKDDKILVKGDAAVELQKLLNLQDNKAYSLDEIKASIDALSEINVGEAKKNADEVMKRLEEIAKILSEKADSTITGDEKTKADAITDKLKAEAKELVELAKQYKASNQVNDSVVYGKKLEAVIKKLNEAGVDVKADTGSTTTVQKSLKAGTDDRTPQTEQPQTQPPAGYTTGNQGAGLRAAGGAGGYNYGWNAGTAAPGGGFDMGAYLNSMSMDQSILNSWDGVNKSQADQQKMMMLFFYFARMAASGDMAAMYRFMYFITTIIAKDKAMQNIGMASKLIDLENKNRESLKLLLDTPAPAANDQQAQARFTQVLQTVQAEQSSVATSQKLISQIMEEMGQVVETLTEATKAALDSNGRVGRIVSRSA